MAISNSKHPPNCSLPAGPGDHRGDDRQVGHGEVIVLAPDCQVVAFLQGQRQTPPSAPGLLLRTVLKNQDPEVQLVPMREYAARRRWEVVGEYVLTGRNRR